MSTLPEHVLTRRVFALLSTGGLVTLRLAAGVTERQAASRLGVARLRYMRWEQGAELPTGGHAVAVLALAQELETGRLPPMPLYVGEAYRQLYGAFSGTVARCCREREAARKRSARTRFLLERNMRAEARGRD